MIVSAALETLLRDLDWGRFFSPFLLRCIASKPLHLHSRRETGTSQRELRQTSRGVKPSFVAMRFCYGKLSKVESRSFALIVVLLCLSLMGGGHAQFQRPQPTTFSTLFTSYAGPNNVKVSTDGQQVQLVLDQLSAAGFGSKNQYLFGSYGARIKLPANDSAGTVTTFYISSSGPNHDEFDFEFLGNSSGQPYLLHTNIFSNGVGGREQQFSLWFDPTKDFHYYNVQWNKDIAVFFIDNTPIRTFKNNEAIGTPFPNKQPMEVYTSIWDGSVWATQGGRVKINWANAPFVATYRNFNLNGCTVGGSTTLQSCQNSKFATPGVALQTLSPWQNNQLKWVKKNYLRYNYCTDTKRFAVPPPECSTTVL